MNEKQTNNLNEILPLVQDVTLSEVPVQPDEIPILTPEQQLQKEQLLTQIEGDSIREEERVEVRARFTGLVTTILSWSIAKEKDVESVKRLGGGFKNPVLMITTAKGEQFVAKGFSEEEGLTRTMHAKQELDRITTEDETLIPKSEIFNDTLFSEKAKGVPVRSLIEDAVNNPEKKVLAEGALFAVGSTLGYLHERTERPIKGVDDLTEEVVDEALEDREKIHKHMGELKIAELLGFSSEEIEVIAAKIDEFTEPEFISLVHGDPHLDNFFHEEGGANVEIVDYDDIREGDPMADLGRSLQSLRYWCEQYGADKDLEFDLTRSLARGYESKRKESDLIHGDRELDPKRVVVYGLRLELVQLKSYSELRSKLGGIGDELGMSEYEIINASEEQEPIIEQGLSVDDRESLKSLRTLISDLRDALMYLRPVVAQESGEADDNLQLAA